MKKTKKNVGITDKILRILVVLLITVLTYSYRASIGTVWEGILYIFALLLIITVIRGKCCIYTLIGIDTRGR